MFHESGDQWGNGIAVQVGQRTNKRSLDGGREPVSSDHAGDQVRRHVGDERNRGRDVGKGSGKSAERDMQNVRQVCRIGAATATGTATLN